MHPASSAVADLACRPQEMNSTLAGMAPKPAGGGAEAALAWGACWGLFLMVVEGGAVAGAATRVKLQCCHRTCLLI